MLGYVICVCVVENRVCDACRTTNQTTVNNTHHWCGQIIDPYSTTPPTCDASLSFIRRCFVPWATVETNDLPSAIRMATPLLVCCRVR